MSNFSFDESIELHRRRVISPSQVLAIFLRWLPLILACTLTLGALGYLGAESLPRQYTASGDLIVDSRPFAIPELQGAISGEVSPDPLPSVRTEAIELRSPAQLMGVVRELHLADNPLFNPALHGPGPLARLTARLRRLVLGSDPVPDNRPGTAEALAADALARRLTVFYDNRSFVITASIALPDPQLAAAVINTLLRHHIAARVARRIEENSVAYDVLRHRIDGAREEIDILEAKLRDLRVQNGLVALPSGSLGQQRLVELASAANRASDERAHAEAALKEATALASSGNAADLTGVLSSPTIARLREREVASDQKLAELRASLGPRHPALLGAENELRSGKAEIASEVGRVVHSLQTDLSAARDREAAAKAALDQANATANQTSIVQSQLSQLEKEVAARRALYQTLLERASQTAPQPGTDVQAPGVHIGSPAAVPVLPSGPHAKLTGVVGAVAGFALGSLVAFVRNTAARSFKDPAEIAAAARVPLLAVLPGRARLRRRGLLRRRSGPAFALPDDALGFLRLRLRQQAMQSGTEIRSVVFVPAAGEDTVDLATQFARAAAHAGERLLLLGTAGAASTLDAPGGYPMVTMLSQSSAFPHDAPSWRDRLVRDPASPAKILPAMPGGSGDASDVRTVVRLRSLFREASDDYSLIVTASSRERQTPLTNYLVDAASYTVLVVDPESSRRSAIMSAFEYYKSINPRLGLVVLKVERTTGWIWRRRSPDFDRRAVLLRT